MKAFKLEGIVSINSDKNSSSFSFPRLNFQCVFLKTFADVIFFVFKS